MAERGAVTGLLFCKADGRAHLMQAAQEEGSQRKPVTLSERCLIVTVEHFRIKICSKSKLKDQLDSHSFV